MSFDGANIQQFPDIPAVSAEILALRGWEGEKRRAAVRAVAFGAALLGLITSHGVCPPVTFGSSVISNDILGGNVPVPDVTQQKIGLMFSQSDFYC